MKKVLSLVMILILSLTACGGKGGGASDDPNLGKYIGEEYSGDGSNWFSLSEIFDEGESYIELKDGGKGVFCLGGDATDIKWTLENGTLKMTRDSLESNGTLKDGIITLTDLWGIGTEHQQVPAQSDIDAALQTVGTQHVHVSGDSVQLDGGSRIDLGGIAKGYAADLCADILKDADADGLLVLGGNIYAVGTNEGKDWNIGIADPDEPTDTVAAVAVHDLSVVTSGDYERYFEQDGVRYHHIFDPETGYPAASGLRSVTVVDENSTRADALTTALFVMGADKGRAYCEKNGIAAVFITSDRQVFTTEKVSELCSFSFTGEDKGYTYAQ